MEVPITHFLRIVTSDLLLVSVGSFLSLMVPFMLRLRGCVSYSLDGPPGRMTLKTIEYRSLLFREIRRKFPSFDVPRNKISVCETNITIPNLYLRPGEGKFTLRTNFNVRRH